MVLDLETGYCSFINAVRARVRVAVDQWPGFSAHAGTEAHLGSVTDLSWLPDVSVYVALAGNVVEHR